MKLDFYRLLIAVLATYRLAQLVSVDDGPLDCFARMRGKIKSIKGYWEGIYRTSLPVTWRYFFASNFYHFWHSAAKLIECPFCTGVWFAPLPIWLYSIGSVYTELFLLWLAIAGGQAFLQEVSNGS